MTNMLLFEIFSKNIWKNIKKLIIMHLKYHLLQGMKNLNYLMDLILYISRISKKAKENRLIILQNRITFKFRTRFKSEAEHYLELLMP